MSRSKIMREDELLRLYAAGERDFTKPEYWIGYSDLTGADLSGANFSGLGINLYLEKSILRRCNFSNCIWIQGCFDYADLARSDLSGADMGETTFKHANITGVNLTGTILTDANLLGAILEGANLEDAIYERIVLPNGSYSSNTP